ncbi:DUF4126 family protein [Hyalangium rubrum]|uniref:DUF4126 family protein n=1 Tax=Hyalangium rubrum TaxID=3103134 RepID=A0ABU5H1M8_9BACT|nr:DUF4126 family protein [Hyalangium sp. s54d21]MDY7227358.1 DUF4126 family protein [Hyalangium sp. s54d21]
MIPFTVVSQAMGLSSASGTRAGLSLLAVALASHQGYVSLPDSLGWMAHPGAMAAFAVVLVFEMITDRDEDMHMLLGLAQYGLSAGGGALSVMASMNVATQGIPEWAVGAGGAGLAIGTLALRRRMHVEFSGLESELFHPLRWLTRLQEGGALGLCVAVFFAPAVALGVVVVLTVAGVVATVMAHRMEAKLFRRPCPACGTPIRVEASRCVQCRHDVPVVKQLDLALGDKARAAVRGALDSVVATAGKLGRSSESSSHKVG